MTGVVDINEIKGHPSIEAHRPGRTPLQISLCAGCNRMRTILFLDVDRWFCIFCRNDGSVRPTQISMFNPPRS